MKRNQLLSILAFIMALGIEFPATDFSGSKSSTTSDNDELNFETFDDQVDLLPEDTFLETLPDELDEVENISAELDLLDADLEADPEPFIDDSVEEVNDLPDNEEKSQSLESNPTIENPELTENGQPVDIKNASELMLILHDERYEQVTDVRLINDLIVDADLVIGRAVPTRIDLNGHSIISCGNELSGRENAQVLDLEYGDLSIVGKGSIMAMGAGGVAISVKGSINRDAASHARLTVGREVNLIAPNSYAMVVAPTAGAIHGIIIDFAGSISAQDGIYVNSKVRQASLHAPKIHLTDSARILTEGSALIGSGYANWQIDGAEINSTTGVVARTGKFVFTNTKILANMSDFSDDGRGSVFLFGPKNSQGVVMDIRSGTYQSEQGYVFFDTGLLDGAQATIDSLEIVDGEFFGELGIFEGFETGDDEIEDVELATVIRGGHYSSDVTEFLAPGMHLESSGDVWLVIDENALTILQTKAELQALVDTAKSKEGSFYEEASFKTLIDCLKNAELALSQSDPILEQLELPMKKLSTALKNLQPLTNPASNPLIAVRQELFSAIASAKSLNSALYDKSDYQEFMDLIVEAELLLADPKTPMKSIESMLGAIDAMREILMVDDEASMFDVAEEFDGLEAVDAEIEQNLDFDELGLAEVNEAIIAPEPTPSAQPKVQSLPQSNPQPIAQAIPQTVSQSTPQTQLKPQTEPQTISKPSKTVEELHGGLSEMLAAVSDLTLNDYLPDHTAQYYDLQAIITTAQEMLSNHNTPASMLAEVMNKILIATSGLKETDPSPEATRPVSTENTSQPAPSPEPVDLTILREMVSRIAQLDASKYTRDSYMRIIKILEKAKNQVVQPNLSQAQVDQLVLDLYQATMDLVSVPVAPVQVSQPTPISQSPVVGQSVSNFSATSPELAQATMQPQPTSSFDQSSITPQATQNSPENQAPTSPNLLPSDSVTPSLMMSALAGMYTGLAMYRKSRIVAKNAKRLHRQA